MYIYTIQKVILLKNVFPSKNRFVWISVSKLVPVEGGDLMYWKKRVIVFTCIITCFVYFFSTPLNSTYAQQNNYTIRVRVKKSTPSIKVTSKQAIKCRFPTADHWISLPSENSPFVVSAFQINTPVYYIETYLSWNNPVKEIQSIRSKLFANCRVSFYLSTKNQLPILRIGPFYKESEASFIASNIPASNYTFQTISLPQNTSLGLFDLANGIYLQQTIDKTLQPTPLFIVKSVSTSTPISLGSYSYYGQIHFYFHSTSSLSAVNHVDLETYLKGVVPAEISSSWHLEALKAQAITARTFALKRAESSRKKTSSYYDVTDDTYCQVYLGSRQAASTNKAVDETKGLVLTWNNTLITSPFHSCSGGLTESNANAWNSSQYPYLVSVESPGEEISPHYSWYKQMSISEFKQHIINLISKKKNRVVQNIDSWELVPYDNSTRVKEVSFQTEQGVYKVTGLEFQYHFDLKSNWFGIYQEVTRKESNSPPLMKSFSENQNNTSTVYLYGKGWGHGVGLPQYGAEAAAIRGEDFSMIATRYYRNTNIVKMQYASSDITYNSHNNYATGTSQLCFLPTDYKTFDSDTCWLTFTSESFNSEENNRIEIGHHPTVNLHIETASNVFGITFFLFYTSNVVDINPKSFKVGDFLKANDVPVNSIIKKEISEDGVPYIHVALSREGKENGGVSGRGTLLSFTMETIGVGNGSLHIESCTSLDGKLEPIQCEIQPVSFLVKKTDREPPTTTLVSNPPRYTNQKTVQFRWKGNDPQTPVEELTYSFRLNNDPWSPYTAETAKVLYIQQDGEYVFSVRTKDSYGNVDPTPPTYIFTVDTIPPSLQINPFPDPVYTDTMEVKGYSEFGCTLTLNEIPVSINPDGSFVYSLPLSLGENNIVFRAIDKASNTTTIERSVTRSVFEPIFIWLQIGNRTAKINQKEVTIDCDPFTQNGRTMVPLRFIAESFGANVEWIESEQKITMQLSVPFQRKIELWLQKDVALVNGNSYQLDVAPFTIPPGRTVVPLRFIAESFDASIEWFPENQSIEIIFPQKKSLFTIYILENWLELSLVKFFTIFNGRG